jgi:hypothetical protein
VKKGRKKERKIFEFMTAVSVEVVALGDVTPCGIIL